MDAMLKLPVGIDNFEKLRKENFYYVDILIEPEDPNAGIIIELKYAQTYDGLEKACEKAMNQIREKRYDERLRNEDRNDIWTYGIAISVERDGKTYTTADGRCLKRLGKNSKPFYSDEMAHVYTIVNTNDFSSQIIAESSVNDINLMVVYALKEKLTLRDPASTLPDMEDMAFLRDLKLIVDEDGQTYRKNTK